MPDSQDSLSPFIMEPTSPPRPGEVPRPERAGLAIASLVLGGLAFLFSLFLVGLVLGLLGLALGLVHILGKRGRNAMAWWGVTLSVIGMVASVGLGVVYFKAFKLFKENLTSMTSGSASSAEEWEGVLAPDFSVTTLDGKT